LESLLKRDRVIVVAGLVVVVALAWAYLLLGAGMDMSALRMTALPAAMEPGPPTSPWTPAYGLLMLVMWWVMMIAMMVPSAAPMILLFAAVNRRQRSAGGTFVPTGIFLSGYLLAWGGFSLVAVALQWGLERAALLSAMMASTSAVFGAALLLAAGIYQLTPLKQACLRHCRSPLHFVTHGWRRGRWGAFRMGLEHGAFCLGCCWFLMGLLFYGGVMNLYWIAGVAVLVLLEKTVPAGRWLGLAIGAGLILWGGTVLVAAL
jgi:predicted metal-binding membrane protein